MEHVGPCWNMDQDQFDNVGVASTLQQPQGSVVNSFDLHSSAFLSFPRLRMGMVESEQNWFVVRTGKSFFSG